MRCLLVQKHTLLRFTSGEKTGAQRRVCFQCKGFHRRQEGQGLVGCTMADARQFLFDGLASQKREQRIGCAIVADRNHPSGQRVQRDRAVLGPALRCRGRKTVMRQRHDIVPLALSGTHLARQLGQDIELEGRTYGELLIGIAAGNRADSSVVVQRGQQEAAAAR